ncbi:MAG: YvcK family protein, partial [Candidatus Brockarchaeota archaeon]|nr:YvcK family protein [Candidatus Brockarchaeota archaeon]
MRNVKATVLCGGVGASRLLVGLAEVIKPENIYAIVNTGDDINLLGFHISPDLDIITYSLAGLVEKSRGWGIAKDTFNMISQLAKYDKKLTWFNLGDKDLATHIFRTSLMNQGKSLSEVTSLICEKLKVKVKVIPMTDEPFETHIVTNLGEMHFPEN